MHATTAHALSSPHTAADIRAMAADGMYGVPVEWPERRKLAVGDGVLVTSVDERTFIGDIADIDQCGVDDQVYVVIR